MTPFFHRHTHEIRAVFFSKKGPFVWLMSTLMSGFVALAVREISAGHKSVFAFFILLAAVFFAWIVLSTRYEIHDGDLVIRSGPQRWTIPLDSIIEASPASRWTPGPALSLDRLQINYVHKSGQLASTIISPTDRDDFLEALRGAIRGARGDALPPAWDGTHPSYRGRATAEKRIEF